MRPSIRFALFLCLFFPVAAHGATVAEILEAWRAKAGAPGATAAVVGPDGALLEGACGHSRKDPPAAMMPQDRMLAGSVGKTFVAAVMLQLVAEGRADLDAKVSSWLGDRPWFARLPNAQEATLRQIMNHTSGIAEHVQSERFTAALKSDPAKSWAPDELIAFALDASPLFPAGEGWSYADTNYILVGMVIEKITGRTVYREVQERLLTPLALRDTSPSDRPNLSGLVSGYVGPDNPFPVPQEVAADEKYAINPQFEWCGGGFISTAPDLARWAGAFCGGDVVPAPVKARMLDGVAARTGPGDQYGLGVQIIRSAHGRAVGHSGWFPGYVTMMLHWPDHGVSVAVQINTDIPAHVAGLRRLMDDLAALVIAVRPSP